MKGVSQQDYHEITAALDSVMTLVKDRHGMSEKRARDWVEGFITEHYLPVWRPLKGDK